MCKNISNRLSEIAPTGRRRLRGEIRLPILIFLYPSVKHTLGLKYA